jgi:hypothetical protein
MRQLWNRLLLRGFDRGCCCGSVEAQELSLVCWWLATLGGDDCMRLPDPLGFFGFAVAVDDDGLPGYGLLEVLLLQSP